MRILPTGHGASMTRAAGSAFNNPLVALTLQKISQIQPGPWCARILSLKMDCRIGLILTKRNLGNRYVHAGEVLARRKVFHDAAPHGILVLDILFAATQTQTGNHQ